MKPSGDGDKSDVGRGGVVGMAKCFGGLVGAGGANTGDLGGTSETFEADMRKITRRRGVGKNKERKKWAD
jgi:hypothetical protein